MKKAHSSYIIVIIIVVLLDIWYSSLIQENVEIQSPTTSHSDFFDLPASVENISSDEPVQTITERIELYNDKFDYMTGPDFEEYCADLLRKNGFTDVTVTSASGDFGVDILANQNKTLYAIQCKCYSSDIGVNAIYQVAGGMKYYNANVGVVLTNRYFTRQAKELASKIGVVLWDRDFLLSLITPQTEDAATRITDSNYTTREHDIYFEIAAEYIIKVQTTSVEVLQERFKIGASRAERILDQLCEAGIVGSYNGIHPREILMNMEEFEEYLKNH